MKNRFVMNTKPGDYRVLVFHEGLSDNKDYIFITDEEFAALSSGKKTGGQIIKERYFAERMEEIKGLDTGVIDGREVKEVTAAPAAKTVAVEVTEEQTNTREPLNAETFMKGKSSDDLREIGKNFGLEFTIETRRIMAEQIIVKMNEKG